MAVLTVAPISRSGLVVAAVAAAGGGDSMPNTGREFLLIKNGSGGPITVSAVATAKIDGQTTPPKAVVVAASAEVLFGPFAPADYSDTNERVGFTYSGVTSLTVQAIRLPA
jgi:hypothetical protein